MGQVPCCELVPSNTRSSIDGVKALTSEICEDSEQKTSLKQSVGTDADVNPPNWKGMEVEEPQLSSDKTLPCERPEGGGGDDSDGSKLSPKQTQQNQISAVKAFVKALVRGHPSTLVSETGEQRQCILILDKAIRTLLVCESRASQKECVHEIPLGSVQDVAAQDVTSLADIASARQYKAGIRWFPEQTETGPERSTERSRDPVSVVVLFPTQRERDLFSTAFSTLCRQVQALNKLNTGEGGWKSPSKQSQINASRGSFEEREPGEIEDTSSPAPSMFHTTPAKFVSFGNTSISEVSAHAQTADDLDLLKDLLVPNSGRSIKSPKGLSNPNQGTLQKSKDGLSSRPWKPPSLVL
eukprot:Skav224553  [mRNA]  locus=scaffold2085:76046:77107:+ [translate_table: standard]